MGQHRGIEEVGWRKYRIQSSVQPEALQICVGVFGCNDVQAELA